jgi:hypothetical protein
MSGSLVIKGFSRYRARFNSTLNKFFCDFRRGILHSSRIDEVIDGNELLEIGFFRASSFFGVIHIFSQVEEEFDEALLLCDGVLSDEV